MKKYSYLILFVTFLFVTVQSSAQNFFPLSVGNKYQIKHWHDDVYFGSFYTNYTTKYIIDDTLEYNGEVFYKYHYEYFLFYDYFLFDSVQQKLFIYNTFYGKQLAADFNLNSGEQFISYIRGQPDTAVCNGIQNINVFGEDRLQWEMEIIYDDTPPFNSTYIYDFVDEIGFYNYYTKTPAYNPNYTVFDSYTYYSAIIGSQIYNFLNLSLNLLTPLEDTQISDFPFSLIVSVNMPQVELLDSLYLHFFVVRDSEIIWEDTADFDRTYFNVTVNPAPSILEVGDKVKLKIVATDNSIFENYTTLPDSGYYTITVLPDQQTLKLYPLATGNKWVYDGIFWDQGENYTYIFIRKVNSIVTKPNQLNYYEVEEYRQGSPVLNTFFERVDSLSGYVYRYSEDSIQSNYEYLLDDLTAAQGDTVMSYRFLTNFPYTLTGEGDTTIFQIPAHYKTYDSNYLIEYQYTLAQNFGLISVYNYFDFGSDIKLLKGAIINGTVYGDTTVTAVTDHDQQDLSYSLSQNYPNPFNPGTNISYTIPQTGLVTIKLYDVLGNEVTTLVNEEKPAGIYNLQFIGSKLSSGIYYYKLTSGNFVQVKKMLLLK